MMAGLLKSLRFALLALTIVSTLWAFQQNPFSRMFVARSAQELEHRLSRLMVTSVTAEWVERELAIAVDRGDLDRVELVLALAEEHMITVPDVLVRTATETLEREATFLARAGQCAACAADITNCERFAHIAACALPVELTPLGDLNALRRAGVDWTLGNDIDRLDLSLAFLGLGATGISVASGGSSLTIKAGATFLRMANRLGALTPAFAVELGELAARAVDWAELPDVLTGTRTFAQISDASAVAKLKTIVQDLNLVRSSTSSADALLLLRQVETSADVATLSRVSQSIGPATRPVLEVLGKSRVFRAVYRLSDLILVTFGLLLALAVQIASFAGLALRRIIRRRRVWLHKL